MRCPLHLRSALVLAVFAILESSACTVPLAPGFHVEREQAQAEFVSGASPRLHIHGRYHLINSGNASLSSLDVLLPNPDAVARENLQVTVDGAPAEVAPILADDAGRTSVPSEIRLPKAWPEKQRMALEVDFDIAAANGRSVLLAENGFALDYYAWFPRFQAPKRFLARVNERASPTDVSLIVPRDFTAASAGQALGKRQRGSQTEYRFRLRTGDPDPFLVSGRYNQQSVNAADSTVIFWTFANLPSDAAQHAAQEIGVAASFFDRTFGARSKKGKPPIWIVESPVSPAAPPSDRASQTLPDVVLLAPDLVAQDISRGQVTDAELTLLAQTWTRWSAFPRADERFLGPSLATYAVNAWHELREGTSARNVRIAALIHSYDEHAQPQQSPASGTPPKSPRPTMTREKASLFLAALDDQCTPSRVHQGLAYALVALRGREYGYDDLRSALYSEGCQNLPPSFRVWLNQPGIPEDFRSRYVPLTPATSEAAAPSKPER